MQDWLSYRLSDLLLFSEQSYLRQFELYNQWLSPWQWLFYLYGIIFLYSLLRPQSSLIRILFLSTVPLWLICSYGFMWQFYSAINWLVDYFIVIIFIQVLLILWAGLLSYPENKTQTDAVFFYLGVLLWMMTLIVQSGTELLSGRIWSQLSVFAATPDSLAFMTIAFMLLLGLPALFSLLSALWLLFSMLTYIAMDSMTALFPAFGLTIYLISISVKLCRKTDVE